MKNSWALQDAKNKFSEIVEKAIASGPQLVTKRGEEAVVIISINDFKKLKKKKVANSLTDFFNQSPFKGLSVSFDRNPDLARKIKL